MIAATHTPPDRRWSEPDWSDLDQRRAALQIQLRTEYPDWTFPQTQAEALRGIVMQGRELVCHAQMLDDIHGIRLINGLRLNRQADDLEAALTAAGTVPYELAHAVRLAVREMRDLA